MGIRANRQGSRLVDAHVHIRDTAAVASIAASGIAAVRDGGLKISVPPGIAANALNGSPVIISARWALYKQGGYGALFGVPVGTREEITAEISKLQTAGARIIKAMASGMVSLKEPGRVTAGGFDCEELLFIVQEAAARGMGVMAHANGERAVLASAAAGVRSIEHGFFMTERALDVMARKGIFWVPTVGALKRAARIRGASSDSEEFVAGLLRRHLAMLQRAHRIGVPLAVGTDCVLPDPAYREAYDAELAYFEEAGIGRDEVVGIACEDGARLLGI